MNIFEKGDQGDKFFVLDLARPFFEDYGIFGLFFGVGGDGIY